MNDKKIYLVYDFHIENDFIPSGLNIDTAEILFDNLGKINNTVTDYYFKKYRQIPANNVFMNINDEMFTNKISIFEYEYIKEKDPDAIFIYLVEPFANINHILGTKNSFTAGKPFLEFASDKIKKELSNPNNKFYCAISFSTEGDADSYIFEAIYDISERYNINKSKIIFVSASYNVEELHQKYIRDNNLNYNEYIKTFYWSWSLREKAQEAYEALENSGRYNIDGTKSEIVKPDDVDKTKKRNKKFLIFNRRLRAHRIALISLLGKEFIKNNYVSFDLTKGENDYSFDFFSGTNRFTKEYEEIAFNNFNEIEEEIGISSIDFENVHGTIGFGCEVKAPYLDSYIHVVTETNFYEPGVYFSEKTWKPILNLQPFIELNYYHSLKALKEMGFKTFHPFIDESYDNIENHEERMIAIYKEIKRLDTLSIDELHEWYFSIVDILIHNRELALNHRMRCENQYKKESEYINSIKNYIQNEYNKKN